MDRPRVPAINHCPHQLIRRAPIEYPPGKLMDWWECCQCQQRFVPALQSTSIEKVPAQREVLTRTAGSP